jgi:(p)ppGpp synthase/HD superfamily hydrolase
MPTKTRENYQSFMERCEVFFPHHECVRISVAYKLGKFHHRAQTRVDELDEQGKPVRYFEHLRRTALILMDELALSEPDMVIAALLHDSIEDTRMVPEEIALVFGAEISHRVMLMSKKPKQGYVQRLIEVGDWKVWTVKGCDRLDNNRSLPLSRPEFRLKQVKETREIYYPLMDMLCDKAPSEQRDKVARLRSLLRDATEAVPLGQ